VEYHLSHECKYRPSQCPDCLLEGLYCYILRDHKIDCLMALQKCPAQACNVEICSALVLFHTLTDCQFTPLECKYSRINCTVKLPRPELVNHEKDQKVHLLLLLDTLEKYNNELEEYKLELNKCKIQSIRCVDHHIQCLNTPVKIQQPEINKNSYPTTFDISNFSFFSSTTHQLEITVAPDSYKLQLEVAFDAVGQRIRTFLYMARGPHDKFLHWPFSGEVKIELLDQRGGRGHYERTLNFPASCGKKVEAPLCRSEQKYCFHDYLLYQELRRKRLQYVRLDTLTFRVSARFSRSWLTCATEPRQYYMP